MYLRPITPDPIPVTIRVSDAQLHRAIDYTLRGYSAGHVAHIVGIALEDARRIKYEAVLK